jgi:hypothetical protein
MTRRETERDDTREKEMTGRQRERRGEKRR